MLFRSFCFHVEILLVTASSVITTMYSVSRTIAGKNTAASPSVVFILFHLLHALAITQRMANGSVSIIAVIKQHSVIRAASLFGVTVLGFPLLLVFLNQPPLEHSVVASYSQSKHMEGGEQHGFVKQTGGESLWPN